jgi:hypothetical protein
MIRILPALRRAGLVAVFALLGAAAPSPPVSDAEAVKAFLDGLYAHYKSADSGFQMFDAGRRAVFDADMIRLLDEDAKALKGDLGAIDGDWLCDCQDFESIRAVVTVQSASPTTAKASANIRDVGMPEEGVRRIEFDLTKTKAGWRIHDIMDPGQPSLRNVLLGEIASLSHGTARPR